PGELHESYPANHQRQSVTDDARSNSLYLWTDSLIEPGGFEPASVLLGARSEMRARVGDEKALGYLGFFHWKFPFIYLIGSCEVNWMNTPRGARPNFFVIAIGLAGFEVESRSVTSTAGRLASTQRHGDASTLTMMCPTRGDTAAAAGPNTGTMSRFSIRYRNRTTPRDRGPAARCPRLSVRSHFRRNR